MGVLTRILKTIAAFFILLLLTVCVLIFTTPDDIPPFDDSDLIRKIEPIPDNENAYFTNKKAGDLYSEKHLLELDEHKNLHKALFGIGDNIIKANDIKKTKEWLESNSSLIELVHNGNEIKIYQLPFSPALSDTEADLQVWGEWLAGLIEIRIRERNLSKLFGIQSAVYLLDGEIEKSYKSIVNALIFTKNLSSNPQALIDLLLGVGMRGVSFVETEKLISGNLFNNNQLLDIQNTLEKFPSTRNAFHDSLFYEYTYFSYLLGEMKDFELRKEQIQMMFQITSKTDDVRNYDKYFLSLMAIPEIYQAVYSPNRTKQYFANCVSSLVNNPSRNYQELSLSGNQSCQPFRKETVKEKWAYLNNNSMGKNLYNNVAGKYFRAYENALLSNQPSMLITMIALYRYRNDNDVLPDSLDALVPNYLAEVPVDNVDGKPLRYSKENTMIYSIGKDLKDSNGEEDDEVIFLDHRKFFKNITK